MNKDVKNLLKKLEPEINLKCIEMKLKNQEKRIQRIFLIASILILFIPSLIILLNINILFVLFLVILIISNAILISLPRILNVNSQERCYE